MAKSENAGLGRKTPFVDGHEIALAHLGGADAGHTVMFLDSGALARCEKNPWFGARRF
jgi:hypothetical protein